MAERRMFAKTIIDSDAFLEMPQSSQLLYFHLSMRADDEGFINKPKTIMRMVGAKDDDMMILITKKFVLAFESGVIVIKHWRIHNYIRGDRMQGTKYLEEKELLTLDENNSYKFMSGICQADVSQLPGKCHTQDRLGKVRLGKVSIDTTISDSAAPFEEIVGLYNSICISFNSVKQLTDKRKGNINARYKENGEDIEVFKTVFAKVQDSEFLRTGWKTGGKADFDWIMKPTNFVKILEGKYENNLKQQHHQQQPKSNKFHNFDNVMADKIASIGEKSLEEKLKNKWTKEK